MGKDAIISDPIVAGRYAKVAKLLYKTTNVQIADPPVVEKTLTGARVMAWLPVEDGDLRYLPQPKLKIVPSE